MLIKQEWRSNWKVLLIWSACVGNFDFAMLLIYPSLQDSMKGMAALVESMGAFGAAFGMDRLNLAEPIGFYGSYIGAVLSIGGALFAAILGTGMLAKEEGNHTAEYLFTLPYSRRKIVWNKILSMLLIVGVFDGVNLLLGLLGMAIVGETFSISAILLYHAGQLLMHLEVAAICILISACTRKVNMGAGLGIALLLYFMDMMARILEPVKWFRYITPFYYANASDVIVKEAIDGKLLVIGMIVLAVSLAAATYIYEKKDLAS